MGMVARFYEPCGDLRLLGHEVAKFVSGLPERLGIHTKLGDADTR
jgi:hypothetical protein